MAKSTKARQFPREYKLVVIGEGGVGKYCLRYQFIENYFPEIRDPTLEDSCRNQCIIDHEVVLVDILETSGPREYRAMYEQLIACADGFLLVYDITSRQSMEETKTFRQDIMNIHGKDYFPMILVGNKCDLAGDRKVSKQEGEELARLFSCKLIETSAKFALNVENAFFDVIREVRRYSREIQDNSKASGGSGLNDARTQMDMDSSGEEASCYPRCLIL